MCLICAWQFVPDPLHWLSTLSVAVAVYAMKVNIDVISYTGSSYIFLDF